MDDKQDFTSQVDAIFEELKVALAPNNDRERVLDEMALHCMSMALMVPDNDRNGDEMYLFFGAILLLGRTAMGDVKESITKNVVFKRGAKEIAERMYRDDPAFKQLVYRLIAEFE